MYDGMDGIKSKFQVNEKKNGKGMGRLNSCSKHCLGQFIFDRLRLLRVKWLSEGKGGSGVGFRKRV